jgi:hypothetical protein
VTRIRITLVAALLALAIPGIAAEGATAKVRGNKVTHFKVYDTGPGIAWEMRICTKRRTRLRFEAESYFGRAKRPRYDYGRGTQDAGCRLWRLETVGGPEFATGRWRSRMNVAFGSSSAKATRLRTFRVR